MNGKSHARVLLAWLAAYVGVGLILGAARILIGPRSDFHWLGTLLVSAFWWPLFVVGTLTYFLSHR